MAEDAPGWAGIGRARYEHCEFKGAARAFTHALEYQPGDPDLHRWLGRSYARMAETAGPLHASRDAGKARASLERAVELDPQNREYARELFEFYLDSPEWFFGGLAKAAQLVARIAPEDAGAQAFLRARIEGARQEYRGVDWRIRQGILVSSAGAGRIVP
jgi:tetratricopeptide (TPR) repeat protein